MDNQTIRRNKAIIQTSTRIGISQAQDKLWRFYTQANIRQKRVVAILCYLS